MQHSDSTKFWWLLITRGLVYMAIGASLLFVISSFTSESLRLLGGLLIVAGALGCVYAYFTLRVDRNYFWELLRSIFDIGFGIAFLTLAQGGISHSPDIFGFWAVLYAFVQAVQGMYIFMLQGVKQPRNIFGNVLHVLTVVLSGGLAYSLLMPAEQNIPFTLIGLIIFALGVIIVVHAVQQRHTLVINKPA